VELGLGEEFVLVNHGSDSQLIRRVTAFNAHDVALAAHANGFGQRDFRGQSKSEIDAGSGLNAGIDVEADSAGADVAGLRGVLFDRPEVTAGASDVLDEAGVADRCQVAAGDFFTGVPADADVYLLANVLHDWDDARSVQILANCREAMASGGRVLIVERLIPDDPAAALPVLLSDLNMLVLTGGKERTNTEYAALLTEAGLLPGRVIPVSPPYGIIEALSR